MKFLRKRAVFWTIKHGLLSPEVSRFIGLNHLGKRFADKRIETLFSKRKKHFLAYWTI